MPELNAVKTRIAVMHLQATDPEMRALMRSVASRGYEHEARRLGPEECLTICEYIIQESASLHRSLDMRILITSFQDYLQWHEDDSGCHWRDLVSSRLRERPTTFREPVVVEGMRASRKHAELQVAREIAGTTPDRNERYRIWRDRTGKSEAALYRRLAELG